ncbi:hypothetical protein RBB68_13305 [Leptospira interrogans]|uniref:Uncharacterized protein n=4 Tax=Leptospira interrogans TaxID=173 RepID=A0A829D1U9_LEPIR|nr:MULTISPECIES: hypothetical protein [Leptospira]EMN29753.1 hypothetical protein LEP1GSC083_0577 [Leptospira interrogans serovar Pyrogenes str. L0374]EMY02086.1 hypothetical protein LEP1GSC029_1179 [Leptospira interrogans str. 2002000626]OBZ97883.1 Uncharacterized protein A9P81_4161 [Leptospira interrogans serovar Copenhageni/Icterohaemorrhagiae]OCC29858.1 Uncharacterized protein GNX_1670 [Leptospira interrogans serovar Canicola]AAS71213.1 conserved hypothetical protein [Leptospira interrogan
MSKNIKVTKESNTGLNKEFYDPSRGKSMTRGEFVEEIKNGKYPDYHVLDLEGKKIPRSNPDNSKRNNLG